MKAVNRQDHKMNSTKKPRPFGRGFLGNLQCGMGCHVKTPQPRSVIVHFYYRLVNPNKEAPANGRGLPVAQVSDSILNGATVWNYT